MDIGLYCSHTEVVVTDEKTLSESIGKIGIEDSNPFISFSESSTKDELSRNAENWAVHMIEQLKLRLLLQPRFQLIAGLRWLIWPVWSPNASQRSRRTI
jgi:hypothetical protein